MTSAATSTQYALDRQDPPPLGPDSYTAQRLLRGTPEHLHLTSRRTFIGPIPEGWLKSHRKDWYKHRLHLSHYSSRASTFSASQHGSNMERRSGPDAPSTSAMYVQSFPQPDDLYGEDEEQVAEDATMVTGTVATDDTSGAICQEPETIPDAPADTDPAAGDSSSSPKRPKMSAKSTRYESFQTARESLRSRRSQRKSTPTPNPGPLQTEAEPEPELRPPLNRQYSGSNHLTTPSPELARRSGSGIPESEAFPDTPNSRSSLIHREDNGASATKQQTMTSVLSPQLTAEDAETAPPRGRSMKTKLTGLVRFDVPDRVADGDRRLRRRISHINPMLSVTQRRRGRRNAGEIIKMEKMLVRIDTTVQDVPDDYGEKASMQVETRVMEKWREYVVVCRERASEDADYTLEFYKSRVIPATQRSTQRTKMKKRYAHGIPLSRTTSKINLYSSLDKSIMIATPSKLGTRIYVIRSRSTASSVEWYTFLRTTLGWSRPDELQVNVPDMSLTLNIASPFEKLEARRDEALSSSSEEVAIDKTIKAEQAVAHDIIRQCLRMLNELPEIAQVLQYWSKDARMGLAWKRYDRLEWVYGANEQKMYGTIAMQNSHDLELRPMEHYPTKVNRPAEIERAHTDTEDGRVDHDEPLVEPTPVEGFLIRLTSQRGRDQRFGRMFFKRLYFYTHNQYLCFCRPARALPVPHPKMQLEGAKVPTTRQIAEKMPLIFDHAPFALQDGKIKWLRAGYAESRKARHDREAFEEAERKLNTLMRAEGFIDLCNVVRVRTVVRGSTIADRNVGQGDEVDFQADASDTSEDDGVVGEFDDRRTFELVLKNGLIVRLEAYDQTTRRAWIGRLRELVHYWRLRKAADLELFKTVRRANLAKFKIDEDAESYLGQFGDKWEVSESEASSQMYNVCRLDLCRTINTSGVLYHKSKRYSTFVRYHVILCHGQLLIFENSLRKRTGTEVPYSHHERHGAIDLADCYVYSGLITEGDLLYQSQTFDSNHPGRHALPRIYVEDGWTSSDEDLMTYFVLWHNTKKSLFRSHRHNEDGGGRRTGHRSGTFLKQVSQLGAEGRATVFKARSRMERDLWVLSIAGEIEKLQAEQGEEYRVVPG